MKSLIFTFKNRRGLGYISRQALIERLKKANEIIKETKTRIPQHELMATTLSVADDTDLERNVNLIKLHDTDKVLKLRVERKPNKSDPLGYTVGEKVYYADVKTRDLFVFTKENANPLGEFYIGKIVLCEQDKDLVWKAKSALE